MNPRSGGGKVTRFDLQQKAEALGAEVALLDRPHTDVQQLARDALARGADLLGVAGGDGTQALVAQVAAEHDEQDDERVEGRNLRQGIDLLPGPRGEGQVIEPRCSAVMRPAAQGPGFLDDDVRRPPPPAAPVRPVLVLPIAQPGQEPAPFLPGTAKVWHPQFYVVQGPEGFISHPESLARLRGTGSGRESAPQYRMRWKRMWSRQPPAILR